MTDWCAIPFAANYEVADTGEIRNRYTGKIKATCVLKRGGYLAVNLWESNKGKTWPVHLVVAKTFHGERPSRRHDACHSDGNKQNNTKGNIRWATKEENEADKIAHGTSNLGERNGMARLTDAEVREIAVLRAAGPRGINRQLARQYGMSESAISAIFTGRRRASALLSNGSQS